eukprot:12302376-Alexandrium_andersonii.AAC.1
MSPVQRDTLALADGSVVSGLIFQSANDGTVLPLHALQDWTDQQVAADASQLRESSSSHVRIEPCGTQVINRIDSGGAPHAQQQ